MYSFSLFGVNLNNFDGWMKLMFPLCVGMRPFWRDSPRLAVTPRMSGLWGYPRESWRPTTNHCESVLTLFVFSFVFSIVFMGSSSHPCRPLVCNSWMVSFCKRKMRTFGYCCRSEFMRTGLGDFLDVSGEKSRFVVHRLIDWLIRCAWLPFSPQFFSSKRGFFPESWTGSVKGGAQGAAHASPGTPGGGRGMVEWSLRKFEGIVRWYGRLLWADQEHRREYPTGAVSPVHSAAYDVHTGPIGSAVSAKANTGGSDTNFGLMMVWPRKLTPFILILILTWLRQSSENLFWSSCVPSRIAYFRLLEECTSQIVMTKNGVDPDFHKTTFDIDVEPLISTRTFSFLFRLILLIDWLIDWKCFPLMFSRI